jgi:precorrin-2 dehydrogenase / sirohydrochlorin ferrochelatase
MLPISVDLAQIRVVLVGGGATALRRLTLLDEAGVEALHIYAPIPEPELTCAAGPRLRRRLPRASEIAEAQLVFVAGVAEPAASEICRIAKAAGILVNVEDDRERSNFHSAAVIRRGDLTIAISTNGKSPGLASSMRQVLDRRIGAEWGFRLDELAALRQVWRAAGASPAAVGHRVREWIARHGWFDIDPPAPSQQPRRPIP